jgi:hypothetical protein
MKRLQLKWLRDQIGLVNQEHAHFVTTIIDVLDSLTIKLKNEYTCHIWFCLIRSSSGQ